MSGARGHEKEEVVQGEDSRPEATRCLVLWNHDDSRVSLVLHIFGARLFRASGG